MNVYRKVERLSPQNFLELVKFSGLLDYGRLKTSTGLCVT